jgi:hypothetical protein
MLQINGVILDSLSHRKILKVNVLVSPTYLLLCEKKIAALLSQYSVSGLLMLSTTLKPGIGFLRHIACPTAL